MNPMFPGFFADTVRPYGTLDLTDVSLAEEEHTDAGLADTTTDGIRESFLQDRFLEWEPGPLRAACLDKLTAQRVLVHTDTHGGELQSDIQHRVIDDNVPV